MIVIPQYFHVERPLEIAQVVTDHLFTETFAGQQKAGHGARSIIDKLTCHEVPDARFRLPASHQKHR